MVEPKLGGPRAEGEGIIGQVPDIRPLTPEEIEPRLIEGPALPAVDLRPGRPLLPEDLETRRVDLIDMADILDQEIQQLGREIPGSMERIRVAPTAAQFKGPASVPGQLAAPAEVQAFFSHVGQSLRRFAFGDEAEEEFKAQVETLNEKRFQLYNVVWQTGVLNALPVWIEAGLVESSTDIIGLSRPGFEPTKQDIEFMSDAIMRVKAGRVRRTEQAEAFAETLAEGQGDLSALLNINSAVISSQELVNELVAAGQFSLPTGIEIEDARALLLDTGFTTAQADAQLFDAATEAFRLSQELKAWNVQAQMLVDEGQKISGGEIVSRIRREQWLRAATQPAIALLRPLEWWAEKVARPIFVTEVHAIHDLQRLGPAANVLAGINPQVDSTPDVSLHARFLEYEAKARSEGASKWEAKALAFDNWEAPWYAKMGAEIAGDPISLVGFGVYTKITKPIPALGTAVRHTEFAFNYMGEVLFRGLSKAWRATVPRTLQQRGGALANEFTSNLMHALSVDKNFKVPFRQTRPEDLRPFIEEAIAQAATNPQALDKYTGLGRQLIIHQPFEAEDIRQLYQTLGLREDLTPITSELVSEFNRMFELSAPYGQTTFLNIQQVAEQIAKRVLGDDSDAIIRGVRQALDDRVAVAIKAARKTVSGNTLREQVLGMSDHIREGFVKAQQAGIRNVRFQSGLVGGMMDGLDLFTRAIWMDKVDRFVTQKIARAYLVFGFYSVANIAEAGTKTIFAGVSPIFRRSAVYDTLGVRVNGLQGLPVHLSLPGQGGFDLAVGAPLDELRHLAQVRKEQLTGSVLTKPFRRLVRNYVLSYNEGRVLRSVGNDLQTAFGYNLGTQITNAQLANYLSRIYYKVLAQTAPDHMDAAARVIDDVTSGFEPIMQTKVAEAYREALFDYLITGNKELIENFTSTFTPGRVHSGEIAKALDNYVELPTDIKDTFASMAETGTLWSNMDEMREVFEERIFQHYFSSAEVFENSFRELFDDLFSRPVINQVELNEKVEIIRNTLDVFDDMTHNTLAAAVTYSRTVRSSQGRDNIFQAIWTERILPNLERVTFGVEDAARELRESLDSQVFATLPQASKDKYNIIIDQLVRKATVYQQARRLQNETRTSYFRRNGANFKPSDRRDSAFWDGFFRDTDRVWEDARSAVHGPGGINQQLLGRSIELDNISLPPLENLSTRPLSRADVARLYGVHPADLERSVYLTDIMAIQGKDNFVDAALVRAQIMAQQQGVEAEAFGWTRPALEDAYRSIVRKMKSNPDVTSGIEVLQQQLDSAFTDVRHIGFRRNALMDDEKMQVVQGAVDDLLQRIQGKPLAPRLINEGVAFVPEIRPGATALPSGEAQAARRSAIVRDILAEDKAELEAVRDAVNSSVSSIKGNKRRDFNSASTRLGRLRDKGVDIRRADAALNQFGDLRDAGQGRVVREARIEAWDEFTKSLDTLSIDVDATLEKRAVELGKEHLLPGQPGAAETPRPFPTGTPEFVQNLVNAGLPEGIANEVSGVLQNFGGRGETFTRRAFSRAVKADVDLRGIEIIDDLIRLGIVEPAGENTFRIQGATARSRITQDIIREDQFPEGPTLEFTRKNLRTFHGANEPADWVLREIFEPESQITGRPLRAKVTGDWQQIRQAAFDESNARRQLDFPDYENQTALSYVMKAIFPFWGYEAHRWAWWLPREAVRHPGVWASWGKYVDNTDQGYISIPNLPLDVNALRGGIFMGGMRRLQQRDFPEYYDRFKGMSEFFDYSSRWGFYPGFPVGLVMATWGAKSGQPQWGELLPASARNAFIDVPSAVAPEAWERVRQVIFPDRFRDFMIANEVSRLDFDKETGINGMELLRKNLLDEEFTEEETAIWARAARGVATWSLLMEQTGLFRLRPEEKTQVYKDVNEILSKETGVPIALVEDMRRFGIRFEDIFGALSPETQKRLNGLERYQRFAGGSIALLPSEEGKTQALSQEFWATVENTNEEARTVLLAVEQDFLRGRQTFRQWEDALVVYINSGSNVIESLKATQKFKDVPVTQDERLQLAQERGIKIFFHPLTELRTLYFERELEKIYDEDTGQVVFDFDGLFLYRDVITQSLPDKDAEDFQDFRRRNDTPLTALRFDISQTLFRPYKNLRDITLASFEPEEQLLIREFLAKVKLLGGSDRADEIKNMSFGDGDTSIITEYNNRVRTSRKNLRIVDPELDAWLNVFGEVNSFQTAAARVRHDEITRQLQVGNLGGVVQ